MPSDRWTTVTAGLGACVVVVLLAQRGAEGLGLLVPLFLLAPLTLVPLGLRLVDRPEPEPLARRIGRQGQPLGAAGAVLSFIPPTGGAAAALASAWLLVAIALAAHGVGRLWRRRSLRLSELCIDAGLLALPVGAVALVLSRLGVGPLGFGEPIVLLTAVHFHYAGFATLVLTGLAGRALQGGAAWPRRLHAIAALGALTGTPLLALGITLSPGLELLGAATLVSGLLALSILLLGAVRPWPPSSPAQVLLAVSAVSVWVPMAFALAYAWGEFQGETAVGLIDMARAHGTLNALGFSLCGFLAYSLEPPAAAQPRA